jgi:hypothetical protein
MAGYRVRYTLATKLVNELVEAGDGIRFSSPGLTRTDLEPVSSTRSGAVTILRFRVRK